MRHIRIAITLIFMFFFALSVWESQQPNRILEFERSVITAPENTDQIFDLERWPEWHHEMASATQNPDQTIMMHLKPKGWKNLYLTWDVLEWNPDRGFRLRLKQDSSEKLFKAFEWVEVAIQLKREDSGVKIVGTAQVKTRSARVRFLSRFSERIIMNQVFYPDLASFQFNRTKTYTPPGF